MFHCFFTFQKTIKGLIKRFLIINGYEIYFLMYEGSRYEKNFFIIGSILVGIKCFSILKKIK